MPGKSDEIRLHLIREQEDEWQTTGRLEDRNGIEIANKLREKVRELVFEYFIKQKGYCLLIEKQNTVGICDGVDITNELIELLNSQPIEEDDTPENKTNAD